eukprot:6112864-Pyramimonas_sp.AAC.1
MRNCGGGGGRKRKPKKLRRESEGATDQRGGERGHPWPRPASPRREPLFADGSCHSDYSGA